MRIDRISLIHSGKWYWFTVNTLNSLRDHLPVNNNIAAAIKTCRKYDYVSIER